MTNETESRVALDRVNVARNNGTARKIFIARVSELLSEYEQGRGATACLADIKAAYMKVAKSIKPAPPAPKVTDEVAIKVGDAIADTAEIDFNGMIVNRKEVALAALTAAQEANK